jgi:hypothetical protein
LNLNKFRILNESASDYNDTLFFADPSTKKVGVGTNSPNAKFHVSGSELNSLILASGSTNDSMFRITQKGVGKSLLIGNSNEVYFQIGTAGNVSIGLDSDALEWTTDPPKFYVSSSRELSRPGELLNVFDNYLIGTSSVYQNTKIGFYNQLYNNTYNSTASSIKVNYSIFRGGQTSSTVNLTHYTADTRLLSGHLITNSVGRS